MLQAFRMPALPVAAGGSSSQQVVSALPLAALAAPSKLAITSANRTLIELHNVTLVVPALDFLALLTLATDGGASSVRRHMDMATQQHAAMLQQGMQTLQLESLTPCCSFTLGAYTGWGVNASLLTLQPQTPLPDAVVQRLRQPPAGASAAPSSGGSTTGLSSAQLAGVIVGCVAGGVVLLAGLVAAAVALSRRRRGNESTAGRCAPHPHQRLRAVQWHARAHPRLCGLASLALLAAQVPARQGHRRPGRSSGRRRAAAS